MNRLARMADSCRNHSVDPRRNSSPPAQSLIVCGRLAAIALILSSGPLAMAADETEYQFARNVEAVSIEQAELWSVELDGNVYSATQRGLADIRLWDGDGKPVSFLLRKVKNRGSRTVWRTFAAKTFAAKPIDGGLEIVLTLDDKAPNPSGLQLVSPLKNFEQRMRVETSADGMQWEPAGEETLIFDYSRYMDVRNDGATFPETSRRHFRIVIDDVTVEQESELLGLTRRLRGNEEAEREERITIDRRPFRIDRIEFRHEVELQRTVGSEKVKYPVGQFTISQDAEQNQTIVTVDSNRAPLTSLKIETDDDNFSRRAVVEVEQSRGVNESWQQIGSGTISRIAFKDLNRDELTLSFPETRAKRFRVVISNRDNAALDVAGMTAEGNAYELVFLANPEQQYELVYGAEDARAGAFDTAAIHVSLLQGYRPIQVGLGPQRPAERMGPPPGFAWANLINHPLFLGSVATLFVIALGWGLYRAVQRMDSLPGE